MTVANPAGKTGLVSVRLRPDRILIGSHSLTRGWTGNGHVEVLDREASPEALGAAVRRGLAASEIGASFPEPDEWKRLQQVTLDAGGVKSWAALERGTVLVEVTAFNDGRIEACPTTRRGRSYGPSPHPTATLHDPSDEMLGTAVREALDLSV